MILMEVPFVYECPITINGTTYLPDFIAYDEKNQRIIIIEYFGMFNNPDYAQAAFKKIMDYYQAGFTPGVNFLMFFDDTFGNIDAAVIRQQLKAVFR